MTDLKSASGRFKIISNGLTFRILIRRKFLWFSWWDKIRHFEGTPWESSSLLEAQKVLESLKAQDAAEKRGWSEV